MKRLMSVMSRFLRFANLSNTNSTDYATLSHLKAVGNLKAVGTSKAVGDSKALLYSALFAVIFTKELSYTMQFFRI